MDYVTSGYEGLAEAVVAQAGRDYLEIKKKLYRIDEFKKKELKLKRELKRIDRFFKSEWYTHLSSVDSKWLKEQLDREFDIWCQEQEKLSVFEKTIGA